MRLISNIIGVIAILGGIFLAFLSYQQTEILEPTMTIIESNFIYARAQHYALLAIVCLLLAIAILLSTRDQTTT